MKCLLIIRWWRITVKLFPNFFFSLLKLLFCTFLKGSGRHIHTCRLLIRQCYLCYLLHPWWVIQTAYCLIIAFKFVTIYLICRAYERFLSALFLRRYQLFVIWLHLYATIFNLRTFFILFIISDILIRRLHHLPVCMSRWAARIWPLIRAFSGTLIIISLGLVIHLYLNFRYFNSNWPF